MATPVSYTLTLRDLGPEELDEVMHALADELGGKTLEKITITPEIGVTV